MGNEISRNESLVFLNKVFTDTCTKSCPLMSNLTATPVNFNQQLTFFRSRERERDRDRDRERDCDKDRDRNRECEDNRCRCECHCDCGNDPIELDFDDELNFVVASTEVIISDFELAHPSCLTPGHVTVNGFPVDDLDFFNERFMAGTTDLMTRIGDCRCMDEGRSTSGFFLIAGAGSWRARMTVVLRGSVFGCGGCRDFKLLMTTRDNIFVDIPGQSTFAANSICLPCTTGGIAPVINFSFRAKATLLNPKITSVSEGGRCDLRVTGHLVTEPIADIQVTRQTLFRTEAERVNIPCDDIARCREFPGECQGEDDDSNAFALRGRCCDDRERDRDRDRDRDREHDRDCERDNDCERERERRRDRGFQFNGCNGCSF